MTRLSKAGVAALLGALVTVSIPLAALSQSGPPATPADLETWSYYDELTEETENGLNLDGVGKRSTMAFSIVVRHARRLVSGPPRSIKLQFVTGGAIVNTEYRPTLKITLNAGQKSELTLDYTRSLAPLTSARGATGRSTEWVLTGAEEIRQFAGAATVRVAVFGDIYDLRPNQIAAIKRFADKVPLR